MSPSWETNIVGTLALARVRVHDGVLVPQQIQHNYGYERTFYQVPNEAPAIAGAPARDAFYPDATTYSCALTITGTPVPAVTVLSPEGATVSAAGLFSYTIPTPRPASFTVTIRAANVEGSVDATWEVRRIDPAQLFAGPVHRYSFTTNADDSVGGAHGTPYGDVTFADGRASLNNTGIQNSNSAGVFPDPADPDKAAPGAYIDLPNGIVTALGPNATFETWLTWDGPVSSAWQRIFDFGSSDGGEDSSPTGAASYYVFLTPRSGSDTLRFGYNNPLPARVERWVEAPRLPAGSEQHVAVVWDGDATTARLFLNGVLIAEDTVVHFALDAINDNNNWLGRSQWPDAMFDGSYGEFRMYDHALSLEEVLGNFLVGPEVVNAPPAGVSLYMGDVNKDAKVDIADAIALLGYLFAQKTPPVCAKAADANDDDALNIADAISILGYLFSQKPLLAPDHAALLAATHPKCALYETSDIPATMGALPGCATQCK